MTLQAGSIAVVGATGKTGQAVVRALRGRGAFVRAVVRTPVPVGDDRVGGADEIAVADLRDADAMAAALADAGGVYLMAPNMFDGEPEVLGAVLDNCSRLGIRRVVYHSVMHPFAPAMPHHLDKALLESRLHDSDLDWTVLQPASYFENALGTWEQIVATGEWPLPYPAAARFTPVALDDVAFAAARVLTEAGHRWATYELAGPQDLSTDEMAATAAQVLGRPVRVQQAPAPESAPERLRAMFDHYAVAGFRGSSRSLGQLLSRNPTTWEQWVRRQQAAG